MRLVLRLPMFDGDNGWRITAVSFLTYGIIFPKVAAGRTKMLLESVGAGLVPAQTWATTRVRPYLIGFYYTR